MSAPFRRGGEHHRQPEQRHRPGRRHGHRQQRNHHDGEGGHGCDARRESGPCGSASGWRTRCSRTASRTAWAACSLWLGGGKTGDMVSDSIDAMRAFALSQSRATACGQCECESSMPERSHQNTTKAFDLSADKCRRYLPLPLTTAIGRIVRLVPTDREASGLLSA